MSRIPGRSLGVLCKSTAASAVSGLRLEVFVDFTCPFSKRITERLINEVKPAYGDKLELIFQPMPQPWHPSSCMVHEAFHAACLVSPEKEYDIFKLTMDNAMVKFADKHTENMTRKQVHDALGSIYEEAGLADKAGVAQNLELDVSNGQVNGGNNATRLLKFYVKQHRQVGIHVSPTVRVNGLVCDSSSGWSLTEWQEFLRPMIEQSNI